LYRFCIERGFLDSLLDKCIIRPFLLAFRWCSAMEKRWTNFLAGGREPLPDFVQTDSSTSREGPPS
jgi:NAD(P)H-quinone oxidoreductase subunit 5